MNITDLIAESRTMAITPCQAHPTETPVMAISCTGCRGDLNAAGDPAARHRHDALRAMHACDQTFPARYRDATADLADIQRWTARVIEDPASAPSLMLRGLVGVGKTWLAYGALRRVLAHRPGMTWLAMPYAEFTASMRGGGPSSTETRMETYQSAEIMLLDDLGAAKASEAVEEVTYRLVNARYESMLPTIYATNCDRDQLVSTTGDRVASRLAGCCTQILIEGPDRRRQES
jgi:DNA replication protein DnaC